MSEIKYGEKEDDFPDIKEALKRLEFGDTQESIFNHIESELQKFKEKIGQDETLDDTDQRISILITGLTNFLLNLNERTGFIIADAVYRFYPDKTKTIMDMITKRSVEVISKGHEDAKKEYISKI